MTKNRLNMVVICLAMFLGLVIGFSIANYILRTASIWRINHNQEFLAVIAGLVLLLVGYAVWCIIRGVKDNRFESSLILAVCVIAFALTVYWYPCIGRFLSMF